MLSLLAFIRGSARSFPAKSSVTVGLLAIVLAGCGSSRVSASATTGTVLNPPSHSAGMMPPPLPVSRRLNGIGATIARMIAVHGEDRGSGGPCSIAPLCFGAPIRQAVGQTFQFIAVIETGGVIDGYIQEFPAGTSLAVAQSQIMKWLPPDATTSGPVALSDDGSCGVYNISSPTLAKVFATIPAIDDPSGVLGVELSYSSPTVRSTYDPNNIQTASITAVPIGPDDEC